MRGLQLGGAGGQHGKKLTRWWGKLSTSARAATQREGRVFPHGRASHWAEGCCPGGGGGGRAWRMAGRPNRQCRDDPGVCSSGCAGVCSRGPSCLVTDAGSPNPSSLCDCPHHSRCEQKERGLPRPFTPFGACILNWGSISRQGGNSCLRGGEGLW